MKGKSGFTLCNALQEFLCNSLNFSVCLIVMLLPDAARIGDKRSSRDRIPGSHPGSVIKSFNPPSSDINLSFSFTYLEDVLYKQDVESLPNFLRLLLPCCISKCLPASAKALPSSPRQLCTQHNPLHNLANYSDTNLHKPFSNRRHQGMRLRLSPIRLSLGRLVYLSHWLKSSYRAC